MEGYLRIEVAERQGLDESSTAVNAKRDDFNEKGKHQKKKGAKNGGGNTADW